MASVTTPTPVAVAGRSSSWRRLMTVTAALLAGAHLAVAVAIRDVEALAVAVSFVLGTGLLRMRRGTAGTVVLLVASVNVVVWTAPAAVVNLAGSAGPSATALPAVMALGATVAAVSSIGALGERRSAGVPSSAARTVALMGVVAIAAVVGLAVTLGSSSTVLQEGDLAVTADQTAFSATDLEVEAGQVSVHLENRDYFWHTFTIAELGVDLRVPVGAAGRVTFEAPTGSYEFVCAVPGHDIAGMIGTLTVSEERSS